VDELSKVTVGYEFHRGLQHWVLGRLLQVDAVIGGVWDLRGMLEQFERSGVRSLRRSQSNSLAYTEISTVSKRIDVGEEPRKVC